MNKNDPELIRIPWKAILALGGALALLLTLAFLWNAWRLAQRNERIVARSEFLVSLVESEDSRAISRTLEAGQCPALDIARDPRPWHNLGNGLPGFDSLAFILVFPENFVCKYAPTNIYGRDIEKPVQLAWAELEADQRALFSPAAPTKPISLRRMDGTTLKLKIMPHSYSDDTLTMLIPLRKFESSSLFVVVRAKNSE